MCPCPSSGSHPPGNALFVTPAQDLPDTDPSLPLPHQWEHPGLPAFSAACVSQTHHWRLVPSWAGKTWVRLVLAVCCSGFGCPPPAQVPRDALQAPELTPSDTREPASALGTGNKFLPWALEDTCSWEPGAPSSALGGTQLGKHFLSKRPRVLQTPTTQLLAGEVLPGVLQAPSDSCVSQEPMMLRAVPFAARQDSCTHHDPALLPGCGLLQGRLASAPWEQWHLGVPQGQHLLRAEDVRC